MDGVPHVTQCPISPGAEFVYRFRASVPGTHFWHSHNSYQRGDGHFGPYVVRQPRSEDPLARLYDEDRTDHILFLQELFHESTREAFVKHHHDTGKNKADSLLINGRGQFKMFGSGNVTTPVAQFRVRPGRRYRFRVASPGFTLCPIVMSVDEHMLHIVASDGAPFRPINVRSFVIHPGERYISSGRLDSWTVPSWGPMPSLRSFTRVKDWNQDIAVARTQGDCKTGRGTMRRLPILGGSN